MDQVARKSWEESGKKRGGKEVGTMGAQQGRAYALVDLLENAASCLLERVVQMYPDLPGKPILTEMEASVRQMRCLELCEDLPR